MFIANVLMKFLTVQEIVIKFSVTGFFDYIVKIPPGINTQCIQLAETKNTVTVRGNFTPKPLSVMVGHHAHLPKVIPCVIPRVLSRNHRMLPGPACPIK